MLSPGQQIQITSSQLQRTPPSSQVSRCDNGAPNYTHTGMGLRARPGPPGLGVCNFLCSWAKSWLFALLASRQSETHEKIKVKTSQPRAHSMAQACPVHLLRGPFNRRENEVRLSVGKFLGRLSLLAALYRSTKRP